MRRVLLVAVVIITLFAVLPPLRSLQAAQPASAPFAVLTQHDDNGRSGLDAQETTLNTGNVNAFQFGKLFTLAVDGQIYAQPLYVPNVPIPNQGTHNVIFVTTMNDSVYAFDADSPTQTAPLWQVSLGQPIPVPDACFGYRYGSYHDIQNQVGIVSTPVISIRDHAIYVLAANKIAPSGGGHCNPSAYVHRLHALDITTGQELFGGPAPITATAPGTGPDSTNGVIPFRSEQQLQRPALLLSNGIVYVAFGSYADTDPYHGWILGYKANTLRHILTYNESPTPDPSNSYYEGGLWQSGQGPTADITGSLYVNSGNGWWTAGAGGADADYGDSIVKLTTGLSVTDWFTPYNQSYLNSNDLDLGSSGVLLIPGTNLLFGGGKQGVLYLLDSTNMGHFHPGGDTQIVQSFQATISEIRGAPVCWNGAGGELCYIWGAGDTLKAFSFVGGKFSITLNSQGYAIPASQSAMTAPWPGGGLSISANGSTAGSGIVWALAPSNSSANGVLYAFDAANLAHELWDSQMNAADNLGIYAKFNTPTVANGKVYVPTFANQLAVYGLLASPRPTPTPSPTPVPLPAPWQHGDIGNVGLPGSASYASGVFTVSGSGADIWGSSDAFQYVYQPWSGDGQIVARVTSQTDTDPWAKAGVMFRETLDPSSTYVDMIVSPGNGTAFQRRVTTGGQSTHTPGPNARVPYWVKLTRQGSVFSGYVSPDGVSWTFVATDTIAMTNTVYAGLPVTAHNNTLLGTATFDNVAVSGTVTQAPNLAPTATPTVAATGSATATVAPAATATAVTSTTAPTTATTSLGARAILGYWPLGAATPCCASGKQSDAGAVTSAQIALSACCASHLAWSPNGRLLAVAGGAWLRIVRPDGVGVAATPMGSAVTSVAWSPDSRMVAAGLRDGAIHIMTMGGGTATLTGPAGPVGAVAWSPNGRILAAAFGNGMVRLWQRDGRILTTLRGGIAPLTALAWAPTSKMLALAGGQTAWVLYVGGRMAAQLLDTAAITSLAWAPDGRTIATGSAGGAVRCWTRTLNGLALSSAVQRKGAVTSLAWSPDGAMLASGSRDGAVRLWDARGTLLFTGSRRGGAVGGVAWAPDSGTLASVSGTASVQLWYVRH